MKHTNIIEESEVHCVFCQYNFTENNMALQYTGIFEVSIRWIHSHGRNPQSGAICALCLPNMVLRVRLNFPGNEQTNDKQKFLRSLVADWFLLYTARKFKFASRRSLIIPSSAFLYIASSCSFISFPFVSSYSVVHHAWCRQLHSRERQH